MISKARLVILSIFLFIGSFVHGQKKEAAAILHVLQVQQEAWNNGDIDHFMGGYWHSDSLAFVGSQKIAYGWDSIIANYKKWYPDTVAMGKLHFDIVKIDVIDRKNAFIIGEWHLTRSIGNIGGHFTLLFKKFGNHWFIVVDHSS